MPVEEHNELRDLVTQTLQAKGVLQKVQAEIRASVFLALEEQDVFKDKSPFINKPLKDYVSTEEGLLAVSLIKEFLEFFNLEFTNMVFDPETHAGIDYVYEGRSKLSKDFMLDSSADNKIPLLGIVVKLLTNAIKKNSDVNSKSSISSSIKSDHSKGSENISEHSDKYANGFNGNSEHKSHSDNVSEHLRQVESDKSENKSEADKRLTVKKETVGSSSLSSLGNLPPLTKSSQEHKSSNKQTNINDLKNILDLQPGSNFEDDLLSDKGRLDEKIETVGSGEDSEIEDAVSEVASAATDENTLDISISKESGKGDYLEDL